MTGPPPFSSLTRPEESTSSLRSASSGAPRPTLAQLEDVYSKMEQAAGQVETPVETTSIAHRVLLAPFRPFIDPSPSWKKGQRMLPLLVDLLTLEGPKDLAMLKRLLTVAKDIRCKLGLTAISTPSPSISHLKLPSHLHQSRTHSFHSPLNSTLGLFLFLYLFLPLSLPPKKDPLSLVDLGTVFSVDL